MSHSGRGMLLELDQYYRKQRISAVDFNCPNRSECSAGCKQGDFVTSREAFVGSQYEKGTLPRLLFIALDASDDWPGPEPENRTLQAMRNEEPALCKPPPIARHWVETLKLAHQILEPIATAQLGRSIPLDQICKHIAHTNSAKCKHSSMGRKQGKRVLFDKCRGFIAGEVKILRPDILVTQGGWAHKSIGADFPPLRQEQMPDHREYGYKIIDFSGRKVIKFETVHPTAYGNLFQPEKKTAYPWYSEKALQFILG